MGEFIGALGDGGTVVSYTSQTGESPVLPLPDLIYRGITLRSFYVVTWIADAPREELEATYRELAALVEAGVLHSTAEARYPLSRYAAVLAHVQRPDRTGKILFVPNGD